MEREALLPKHIRAIIEYLGMGAVILDLGKVDYATGVTVPTPTGHGGLQRSFWLTDGRRVDIVQAADGGIIASATNTPDPDKPLPSFDVVARVIAAVEDAAARQKCIHPECTKIVDRRERESGACCRKHMNFECHHPDCVRRAQREGWTHTTHPFGSQIAERHWPWRAGATPPQPEPKPARPTQAPQAGPTLFDVIVK